MSSQQPVRRGRGRGIGRGRGRGGNGGDGYGGDRGGGRPGQDALRKARCREERVQDTSNDDDCSTNSLNREIESMAVTSSTCGLRSDASKRSGSERVPRKPNAAAAASTAYPEVEEVAGEEDEVRQDAPIAATAGAATTAAPQASQAPAFPGHVSADEDVGNRLDTKPPLKEDKNLRLKEAAKVHICSSHDDIFCVR